MTVAAEFKQGDPLEGLYDGAWERQRLLDLFAVRYARMLKATNDLLENALGMPPGALRLDDSKVRQFILTRAATRVVGIDATTQTALRVLLAEAQQQGLGAWETANGTADGSFPGIQGLFTRTWANRAMTVARTELQQAALDAATDRYQASGLVSEVEARDGGFNDSDSACSARNGRRYAINNPPTLLHPNCTLVTIPVIREDLLS